MKSAEVFAATGTVKEKSTSIVEARAGAFADLGDRQEHAVEQMVRAIL